MKRRIVCIVLLLAMITTAVPGVADDYSKLDHDDILELLLFNRIILANRDVSFASQRTDEQQALLAIEYASYLLLDQFNKWGENKFSFLKDIYNVRGMPNNFEEVRLLDANGWNHREYTHKGWNYGGYVGNNKSLWENRKGILVSTVEKIFDFSTPEQADSFAALVYYIHIIGDYQERDNLKTAAIMIPLAYAHPGETNRDVFYELKYHLGILFRNQKNSRVYGDLMGELDYIWGKASTLAGTEGGINTEEKFQENKGYAIELLDLLQDYLHTLLENDPFFTKVFPRW